MPAIIALLQESERLTLGRVLRDIPHDARAIVAYLLIAGFIYFIWRANRPNPPV